MPSAPSSGPSGAAAAVGTAAPAAGAATPHARGADRPVVLVSGAAKRIGRAISEALAAAGWRVAVHHRQSAAHANALVRELTAAQGEAAARAFGADLADEIQCRALVPAVLQAMGRIDALVNNASLFEHDSAADFSFANMERHWRANTGAPVLLAQAAHRAGARVVVNLLDQKLWHVNPDHLSYSLSKAALEMATRMLAMAFAPATRVCGVAPGITLTSNEMSAAEFEAAHRMTLLGRGAGAEDVARTVRFLVESPAITGTTVLVDGGQHLSQQPRDVVFLARAAVQGAAG
jgi:hypothetical protein